MPFSVDKLFRRHNFELLLQLRYFYYCFEVPLIGFIHSEINVDEERLVETLSKPVPASA